MSERTSGERDPTEEVSLHADQSMPQTDTCHDMRGDIVRDPQGGDFRISQEEASDTTQVALPREMLTQLEKTANLTGDEWMRIQTELIPLLQPAARETFNRPGTCFMSCEQYGSIRPELIFRILLQQIEPRRIINLLYDIRREDIANIIRRHTQGVPPSVESPQTDIGAGGDGGGASHGASTTAIPNSEEYISVSRNKKISELGFLDKHKLTMKLNVERPDVKDWRMLAHRTGLGDAMIRNLGQNYPDKAKEVLIMWQSKSEATTGTLHQMLKDMDRTDLADVFHFTD